MAVGYFSGDSRYYISYTVSLVKQEVNNNRSQIRRVGQMVRASGSGDYSGSPVSYYSSTGPTTIGTHYFSFDFTGYGGPLTLIDTTQWVNHNADGTLSFTSSMFVAADLSTGTPANRQASVSFKVTLPTIPRATTPVVSGGFTTGVAKTIDLPRAVSGFTHDVSWKLGAKSGSVATGAGESTSLNLPHSVMTELPNAASGQVEITVVTKNGATVIGTRAVNFSLTAGAAVVPSVTDVDWDDANSIVKSNIGGFVQGLSLVKGVVYADEKYGSPITSRSVVVGGQTYPENTAFLVSGSGTVSATAQATDSRGRTGSAPTSFKVLPYSPIQIGANGWQVSRANAANVPDDNGKYLRIDLHASVSSLIVDSAEKNNLRVSVTTRPTNGAPTPRNIIDAGLSHNGAIQVEGGAQFLTTQSYEVEILLTDNTSSEPVPLRTVVGTSVVTLDLNGDKVGVGKMHENGALDVSGDIHGNDFYGNSMYSDGVKLARVDELETTPAGSIMAWPSQYPPVNWLICNGQAVSRSTYSDLFAIIGVQFGAGNGSSTFNLPDLRGRVAVGHDSSQTEFTPIGKGAGAKTHTLTTAQMPAHTHGAVVWYSGTSTLAGSGTIPIVRANTTKTTDSAGGGEAHNNLQPYLTVNYIIKASGGIDELSSTVESILLSRVADMEYRVNTPPAFYARLSANHARSGTNSWVKIPFNNVKLNVGNHYNSTLARFVAPIPGTYEFTGSINTTTTTGGPALQFVKNGVLDSANQNLAYNNPYMSMTWTENIALAVGDYVEIFMSNANNTAITLGSAYGNYFSGKLL